MSPSRFEPHPERRPAVVAGASSGIGEAVARALAAASHPVVLGARRLERCAEVAAAIEADGGEAIALPLDVTDDESVEKFAAGAEEAVGPVEVLVSNAGDSMVGSAVDTTASQLAEQLDVNLLGAQRLVRRLVAPMVERRRGDVVFVTSDIVPLPRPRMAAYAASKWGLEGLATVLRMELEGSGVRASIVRPGPTLTEMGWQWDPDLLGPAIEDWARFGLARHDSWLRPEHVAQAVAGVVSMPRGAHVTVVEVQPEAPVQGPRTGEDA
ncbi:MAG: SDR family oxidoreductase [Actinobacteria bacterium]|nr:SDR family oxidoreductase [Actinomycetota bacterium]